MNAPHAIAYAIDGALMILIPLLMAFWWRHRTHGRWQTWTIGLATFILSQVVHLPLLAAVQSWAKSSGVDDPTKGVALVPYAIFLGLAAGVCEELARYVVLRWILKHARAWRDGVMFGLGHAAMEAFWLGFGVLSGLISLMTLNDAALAKLPPERAEVLRQQAAAFWSTPLLTINFGWIERCFAICLHVACAVMVLEAVRRKRGVWLLAAVAWHALGDAVTVLLTPRGYGWVELWLAVVAAISVLIVVRMRRRDTRSDVAWSDSVLDRIKAKPAARA